MKLDAESESRPEPIEPYGPAADLVASVYSDLRDLAARYLGHRNWTVQPTALVHEAYSRCARQGQFRGPEHFAAVAATAMRQLLIDHARARRAGKRDAALRTVCNLDEIGRSEFDVLDIDDALAVLAALDERKAKVVELRIFGGMTIPEVARALGISHMTVSNDWRFARAWLAERLAP